MQMYCIVCSFFRNFPLAIDHAPPKTDMLPLKNSRWKTIRLPFGALCKFSGENSMLNFGGVFFRALFWIGVIP